MEERNDVPRDLLSDVRWHLYTPPEEVDDDEQDVDDDEEERLLHITEDSEGEEGREEVKLEFDPDFLLGEHFRR